MTSMIGCNSRRTGVKDQNKPLPDGIYLLLQVFPDSQSIKDVQGRVIPYSHHFLDDNSSGQPFFLDIDPAQYVPLTLSSPPDSVTQPDQRIHLMLSLTPEAKKDLATFTGRNLNKRVAIVIGGNGVTKHKVRSKIDGGKLQITRCTDNACEYLFFELRDNFEQPK